MDLRNWRERERESEREHFFLQKQPPVLSLAVKIGTCQLEKLIRQKWGVFVLVGIYEWPYARFNCTDANQGRIMIVNRVAPGVMLGR